MNTPGSPCPDALDQELWELAFGCHPDPAALLARIDADADLAARFDAVWREVQVVREAAGAPLTKRPRNEHRRAKRGFGDARIRVAAAAMLAALVWIGFVVRAQLLDGDLATLRATFLRLAVTALPTGDDVSAAFRITVAGRDGGPRDATVAWRAVTPTGTTLDGVVPVDGATTIEVPDAVGPIAAFEATPIAAHDGAAPVRVEPARFAPPPLIHLHSDRPLYRPGETVRIRALRLDRLTLAPLRTREPLRVRVFDPRGAAVLDARTWPIAVGTGVHAADLALDDDVPGGRYQIVAGDRAEGQPLETAEFVIRRFDPPRLDRRVTLDRASYAGGERGAAEIVVRRVGSDAPAADATVDARVLVDGEVVAEASARLDDQGRAVVPFELPPRVTGPGRFVARIDDGGTIETEIEPFLVPWDVVVAHAYPEGGALVPGFENRVYVEVTDPRGRPVDGHGRLVDGAGVEVLRFATAHEGRARIAFTPTPDAVYRVEITAPVTTTTAPLPVAPDGVALAAASDGDRALRLTIAQRLDRPLRVAAYCRGVRVGAATVAGAGLHDVTLPVDERARGVLRVTVVDASDSRPLAERLVRRAPGPGVRLQIAPFASEAAPGAPQRVAVTALRDDGSPFEGLLLGVAITDAAVHAAAGETLPTLTDRVALLGDVERLEDRAPFLGLAAETAERIDLLLGTRGWRRFVWRTDAASHAEPRRTVAIHDGARDVARGRTATNDAELHAAARRARAADRDVLPALGFAALAILLLVITEFGRAVLRHRFELAPVPALVGALVLSASVTGVAGLVWLATDVNLLSARLAPADAAAMPGAAVGPELDDGAEAALEPSPVAADLPPPAVERAADDATPPAEAPAPDVGPVGLIEATELRADVEREFAHRTRSRDDVRDDFPLTIYWNPLAITDAGGRARFAFDCGDQVTAWRIAVDAHGPITAPTFGSATATFRTIRPLAIDARLPVEVTGGDRLAIPVHVAARGSKPVELRAIADGPLRGDASFATFARVPLEATAGEPGRSGRVIVPIIVGDAAGNATLALVARAGTERDVLRETLRVVPRGFPHRRTWSGLLEGRDPAAFPVVTPALSSSAPQLRVTLLPNALAELSASLEGLLAEPHGCFEQASSVNYPNVLALTWLERSGAAAPALARRARELLDRGYRKLVGYECDGRGYEWFGDDPGHEALTAYGLLQFADMDAVYPVDDAMLGRTRAWLLGRRDGDGGYRLDPKALDRFGRAPAATTAAWCTWSLLHAGAPAAELIVELDAAAARAATADDGYELACLALALDAGARSDAAARARHRLRDLQRTDGAIGDARTSITASTGQDLLVETTALAVQAWAAPAEPIAADREAARRAVAWILQQRRGSTFGATQATIQALRALIAQTRIAPADAAGGTAVVTVDGRAVAELELTEDAIRAPSVDVGAHLSPGARHEVTIAVRDAEVGASAPWSAELTYHADEPADDPDCALTLDVRMPSRATEGEPVSIRVRVANPGDRGLPMTVATVGLPASVQVPTAVLDDLRRAGTIAAWETRGRELVFYWRGLAPRAVHEFVVDGIAHLPGRTTGPASRAWLYYAPDSVRWSPPLAIEVRPTGG